MTNNAAIQAKMNKQALELLVSMKKSMNSVSRDLLKLGTELIEFRDKRLFAVPAIGAETFNKWLAGPNIGIPSSTAKRYMQIADQWKRLRLPATLIEGLSFSRLDLVLSVEKPDEIKKLLKTAGQMSYDELYESVRSKVVIMKPIIFKLSIFVSEKELAEVRRLVIEKHISNREAFLLVVKHA